MKNEMSHDIYLPIRADYTKNRAQNNASVFKIMEENEHYIHIFSFLQTAVDRNNIYVEIVFWIEHADQVSAGFLPIL